LKKKSSTENEKRKITKSLYVNSSLQNKSAEKSWRQA